MINNNRFYVSNILIDFSDPNSRLYRAECSVPQNLICLGNRNFLKLRPCNWTGGYKWTTALALSITLGGFGADRYIITAIQFRISRYIYSSLKKS